MLFKVIALVDSVQTDSVHWTHLASSLLEVGSGSDTSPRIKLGWSLLQTEHRFLQAWRSRDWDFKKRSKLIVKRVSRLKKTFVNLRCQTGMYTFPIYLVSLQTLHRFLDDQ